MGPPGQVEGLGEGVKVNEISNARASSGEPNTAAVAKDLKGVLRIIRAFRTHFGKDRCFS